MGEIQATLTPHFRDFLPAWIARQPWYVKEGALRPVGFIRFEDPAGEAGIETHLLQDGQAVYQVPLTYRPAPLTGGALITTAEHSELGTRWIYDAVTDPAWIAAVLNLVATNGVTDGPAQARGELMSQTVLTPETVTIDLDRVVVPHGAEDAVGVVTASWQNATGRLAVLRQTGPNT